MESAMKKTWALMHFVCQNGTQTAGQHCSRSWIRADTLRHRPSTSSPERAVLPVLVLGLLLLAHLHFFPFTLLKLGARIHVGPRCFHWKKDYSLEARATAGVFKWMKGCLLVSAHPKKCRSSPQSKLVLKEGQGRNMPCPNRDLVSNQVSAFDSTLGD